MDGADREMPGTLQAKKRALLGQKDRLRLLKKMQSGKERVQRKMERGRSSKSEGMRGGEIDSIPESKPVTREIRCAPCQVYDLFLFIGVHFFQCKVPPHICPFTR